MTYTLYCNNDNINYRKPEKQMDLESMAKTIIINNKHTIFNVRIIQSTKKQNKNALALKHI
ncbi:hypothetical protein BLA29_004770 [Euroglyphus maynei]|uniref:Uncharacterized protein n=1 Tax=Euroglyphus maynei TaxID=6958 RepID=A0A1Y3ANS0_EURMA|nr:hypothetical protein BLA29_004770 [Euroglyphus maynei]